jgi:hypothetical protein
VRYNDYLGIVYKDDKNQIKEIGVLAKVIGIFNQFSFASSSSQSNSFSYVKIEVLGRMKILDFQRHNKESQGSDLLFANVEVLEDEISKKLLTN